MIIIIIIITAQEEEEDENEKNWKWKCVDAARNNKIGRLQSMNNQNQPM